MACALAMAWVQCASPEGEESDAAKRQAEGSIGDGIDMANASRLYIMKCAMCHGEKGEPVLLSAPDLRTSNMGVEERVAIIAYGKGTMPPHRNMLDMATIRGIAVYIEKFRN